MCANESVLVWGGKIEVRRAYLQPYARYVGLKIASTQTYPRHPDSLTAQSQPYYAPPIHEQSSLPTNRSTSCTLANLSVPRT